MISARLIDPLVATKGRKIFVNDLGDLFYEGHTFAEIAAVIGTSINTAASRYRYAIENIRATIPHPESVR